MASVNVGPEFDIADPDSYLDAGQWLFSSFAGFGSVEDQVVATLILAALLIGTSFTGLVATVVLVPIVLTYGLGVAALRVLYGLVVGPS